MKELLAAERWTEPLSPLVTACAAYPGSYAEAVSSLGWHFALTLGGALPGRRAQRTFPPGAEPAMRPALLADPLRTVEARRGVAGMAAILFSAAYEAQVVEIARALRACGLREWAAERAGADPAVVVGGAAAWTNPSLFAQVADAVVVGDGEPAMDEIALGVVDGCGRAELLDALARAPGGAVPPRDPRGVAPAEAPPERLPVRSSHVAPGGVFGDMFLVEIMRGCPHGCTFCVMRRGGPRRRPLFFPARQVLDAIPPGTGRVGLVGASVLDHPEIDAILEELVRRGVTLGLSSLSARRLDAGRAALLARAGVRTATIALDAPSERVRRAVRKPSGAADVIEAARAARGAGISRLKLYVLAGFPGEGEADWRELAAACVEAAAVLPLTACVAPVVPKRCTPLADAPLVARDVYAEAVGTLRRLTAGSRASVKAESWRGAQREHELSRAEGEDARAVIEKELGQRASGD